MQHATETSSATTVLVTSIDGDVTWPTLLALIDEAPTDWSDEIAIPVWDATGERIGAITPDSGTVSVEPGAEARFADMVVAGCRDFVPAAVGIDAPVWCGVDYEVQAAAVRRVGGDVPSGGRYATAPDRDVPASFVLPALPRQAS